MNMSQFIPSSTEKNMKPLSLPECVHLSDRCKCEILRQRECGGAQCSFYRTERENKQSDSRWHQRMNTLNENQQRRIAAAYYGGNKPWKNTAGKE